MGTRSDEGDWSLLRKLLVVAGVLLVLLVGADRGGAYLAERSTAANLRSALQLPERPGVQIRGFPFLTQVARRHLDQVDVEAVGVPTGRLTADTVRARLHDVLLDDRYRPMTAGRVTGTALTGYPSVQRAVDRPGVTVKSGGKDRILVRAPLSILGQELKVSAYGRVVSKGDTLVATLQPGGAGAEDPSADLGKAVGNQLDLSLPLTDLPRRIHVTSATATPEGVKVRFGGRRVPLHDARR